MRGQSRPPSPANKMTHRLMTRRLLAAALGGVLALAFPSHARAQTGEAQLVAAAERLEKTLATLKLSEDDARQLGDTLRDVREQARQGRLRLALNRLLSPWALVAARAYVAARADVKETEAFEAEWKRVGAEMGERERRLAAVRAGDSPLVVRALAEAAAGQARPYYQSGRLYGLNTTVPDGLLYVGLAPAHLDFAIYAHGLRLSHGTAAPKLRSLTPELARVEAETLAAYRRAEAAAAPANPQQLLFNRVNSTLKLAGELDRAGLHAGALQKYLEAVLLLGLAVEPAPDAAESPRLRAQAAEFEKRLTETETDHSLGLLYVESAQAALAGQPDAETLKRAAVLTGRVLPAYINFCCGDKR
jgi:hypothetical protein